MKLIMKEKRTFLVPFNSYRSNENLLIILPFRKSIFIKLQDMYSEKILKFNENLTTLVSLLRFFYYHFSELFLFVK